MAPLWESAAVVRDDGREGTKPMKQVQFAASARAFGFRLPGGAWIVTAAACLWLVAAAAAQDGASGKAAPTAPAPAPAAAADARGAQGKVDDVRAALEKWVETRRILSQEKRDWALGREMLGERIGVVQREIESLRGRIAEAQASIGEVDAKKAELAEENERLQHAASALASVVAPLEARIHTLLARLPEPIRERVAPLSQQIPSDPSKTELSLGTRFQNVVGLLNEVNKFNRAVTVTSEVRTLGDGRAAEVTALYVGIGQGYYVSGDGKAAGIGTATADGWVWRAADDAAPAVAKAIAILKNEQVAGFVQVPIRID